MSFNSILIANRGEIACRIMQTAQNMGIKCIAVYVDADADAPFVKMADESVLLSTSYMDSDAILSAAKQTGAEAVHPGYGFLSENAAFARKVKNNNLIWIGPSAHVIKVMGDKLKAKELAEKSGVPTLPMAADLKDAKNLGYPLLIKAAAGGGGKGMRIVTSPKNLKESVISAQREALSGFGDDRIFIERYVKKSRHIEIQILGDEHGNIVHLGERECSIQRRHQKIIEESPSPKVDPFLREQMGEAALKLAKKIKYCSAGTVEFLMDDNTGEFWFLEVNTRLQVEHPVTEEVTGIDLVYEQIKIARGEELEFTQDDISWHGHSIEARLYAEDPGNNFLPEVGTLIAYDTEMAGDIRWDSGVEQGYKVGTDFDPMLSKVIAWAPNRIDAINKLARGLEKAHFGGVKTNRDFLISCLRNESFINGNTTTDFIEREKPNGEQVLSENQIFNASAAIALWIAMGNRASDEVTDFMPSNWTNGRMPYQRIKLMILKNEIEIKYQLKRSGLFEVMGTNCKIHAVDESGIDVEVGSHRFFAQVTRANDQILINMPFGDLDAVIVARFIEPGNEIPEGGLVAPMPGKVIEVKVKKGDKVKAGDTLIIIEAMKMEHSIKATENGKVTKLMVSLNQQVDNGATLLVLDS
ncbi:biotin/lipoyl-binding protein [Gammaproteobacteria bacterium]|nr:biotin/lipoyl-binding protein [Gammaproteobacteria bacterium]MDA9174507.1 biotin/lipoyl-binding protein [Gammaproteobacteria bacterium]MDA9834673.1 biotin/lipoyl-binding protein [Gammaproteobacteria bacterium]MDC3372009.1 biotin/lipoyl-binding protein [Gammaproteobacteria bacterium]